VVSLSQDALGEGDAPGDVVSPGEPLGNWMLGAEVGVVVGGGVLPLFIVSSHQTRMAIRTRTTTHSHMGTPSRRRTLTSLRSVM
jgi:hypothetical protein